MEKVRGSSPLIPTIIQVVLYNKRVENAAGLEVSAAARRYKQQHSVLLQNPLRGASGRPGASTAACRRVSHWRADCAAQGAES